MGQRLLAVVVVIASACTALHFSTTEHESVVISNNPHHFSGSGTLTFVISPVASAHDVLQSITMDCSSQWSLNTGIDPQQPVLGSYVCGTGSGSQMPVAIDQSDALPCPRNYQFAVSYAGTQAGLSSCNVLVATMPYYGGSAVETKILALSGSGSAVPGITVSPDAYDFKDVPMGQTSGKQTVTVTNLGTTSITVNGSLAVGVNFAASTGYTSFQLGSGSNRQFEVTCTPLALGVHADTLTFTAGAGSNNSGSVSLQCKGIVSTIDIVPSPVAFADTLVGQPPPQQAVRITTNGSGTIETVSLDSTATAAGVTIVTNPQGMPIGVGKDVLLAYSAAAVHEGGPLGTLVVKVSTDAMARNVAISGQALLGGLGTNPASVDFGAVCAGSKTMKDVEVYASEPGDVLLQAMTKPAAPFDAQLMDSVPKTLGGNHTGANMMVRTTFEPLVPGDFDDAIALSTNVPNKPTTEVQLHGIGLAAGIAATPDVVHFGEAAVKTTTSIKEVQFTNCGTGDLAFSRAYITGPNALEFTLIGTHPAKTLKPTESETFMVVMQPDSNGLKTAKLMIEHDQGVTTADLDGTAEGGSEKERETYYACSTGRGAALWPIALALLVLRRRRRR